MKSVENMSVWGSGEVFCLFRLVLGNRKVTVTTARHIVICVSIYTVYMYLAKNMLGQG